MRSFRRVFAALALPVALLSAVPSVQACPYAWSDLTLECLLEIPPAALATGCASIASGCAVAQAPRCGTSCTLDRETAAPIAVDGDVAAPACVPFDVPESPAGSADDSAPASPPDGSGRAWCAGQASGGPGVPVGGFEWQPDAAATLPAFPAMAPLATSERLGAPAPLARGPTRGALRRPPIRAPPCYPLSS